MSSKKNLHLAIILIIATNIHTGHSPDITNPGPDTASFPTSPFTLPKGRGYFENFPLYMYLPGNHEPRTYYWPYLLRIGLTDYLEFRLTGQGLTNIAAHSRQKNLTGLSPVSFGIKVHAWGTQEWLRTPSAGFEFYIIPPIASKNLRDSTQFIINSLWDIKFREGLVFEMNIGAYSRSLLPIKKRAVYTLINWSLQQEITEHLGLFFEGLYTSPNYPTYPPTLLLGVGFESFITKRIAIYGSYNWSVIHTGNPELANLGFAVAF